MVCNFKISKKMKKNIVYSVLMLALAGCYKVPEQKGFLSNDLYLKGADTINLALGSKGNSNVAWLDGSSEPCLFTLENIRDKNGNRSEQFFTKYPYNTWIKPYDNKTDTTMALVKAKISTTELPPVSINPVNGMLQFLETTSNLKQPGDVYHVDVKVKNSYGEKIYKDYAKLKLTSESQPFIFYNAVVAIILVNGGGATTFTLYDNITDNDLQRHQNIYERNGKELLDVYKLSNEPATGIKLLIQYKDADGKVFPAQDYRTYAAGTESYFDYAVNRQNTPDGAMIEFPMTPWPTRQDLLSYLKGGTMGFDKLDTAALHQGVYYDKKYPFLNPWPADSWGASKWFIRLRSKILFKESGTWVISCKFPYTHI